MMWQDGATIECDKQHKAIVQSQRHVRRLRAAVEYILPTRTEFRRSAPAASYQAVSHFHVASVALVASCGMSLAGNLFVCGLVSHPDPASCPLAFSNAFLPSLPAAPTFLLISLTPSRLTRAPLVPRAVLLAVRTCCSADLAGPMGVAFGFAESAVFSRLVGFLPPSVYLIV